MAGIESLVVTDPGRPGPTGITRAQPIRNPLRDLRLNNLRERLFNYVETLSALGTDDPRTSELSQQINSVATQLGREGLNVQLPDWYTSRMGQPTYREDPVQGPPGPMPAMAADTEHWAPPVMPQVSGAAESSPGVGAAPTPPQSPTDVLLAQAQAMLRGGEGITPSQVPTPQQVQMPSLPDIPAYSKRAPLEGLPEPYTEPPQGRIPREVGMGLMETGLRLAASRRPNFLGALAEAGLSGLDRYSAEEEKTYTRKERAKDTIMKNLDAQLRNEQMGLTEHASALQAAGLATQRGQIEAQVGTTNATNAANAATENARLAQAAAVENAKTPATNVNASANLLNALANMTNAKTNEQKSMLPEIKVDTTSGIITEITPGKGLTNIYRVPGHPTRAELEYIGGLVGAYEDALALSAEDPALVTTINNQIKKFFDTLEARERIEKVDILAKGR